MNKVKPFEISKMLVWNAYKEVKANRGAEGIDKQSLQDFEEQLKPNLYRIWNRLSSGSYFPPAVKGVAIPKKSGGERLLGIPTVSDRIAQMVVKKTLEPLVEPFFHDNSYGYRPNRSAHDAISMVRKRCWAYDWVIEFDIKGLFDYIDHDLLMRAVRYHCQIPWVVLYTERWLKASMVHPDGQVHPRVMGTPQGGVISPLLANLFMHYAFDRWITEHCPSVRFCRYADDGVIHCKSQRQAEWVLSQVSQRFEDCGLQIHPDKTRIVYCKDVNRKQAHESIEFTFLGYSFRPRKAVDKYGRVYVNFSPAVSPIALKDMRQKIRRWRIQLRNDKSLEDLSRAINPILRGWWQYYGRFYRSKLINLGMHFDGYLVRWLMNKYKHFKGHKTRAWRYLEELRQRYPYAFVHWSRTTNGRMMGAV